MDEGVPEDYPRKTTQVPCSSLSRGRWQELRGVHETRGSFRQVWWQHQNIIDNLQVDTSFLHHPVILFPIFKGKWVLTYIRVSFFYFAIKIAWECKNRSKNVAQASRLFCFSGIDPCFLANCIVLLLLHCDVVVDDVFRILAFESCSSFEIETWILILFTSWLLHLYLIFNWFDIQHRSLLQSEELADFIHIKIFLDEDFTSTAKFTVRQVLFWQTLDVTKVV